jgi:hypothetical protein
MLHPISAGPYSTPVPSDRMPYINIPEFWHLKNRKHEYCDTNFIMMHDEAAH